MSTIGAALRRIKWEQRMFWRNPAAAAFTFAFPLMFLVVFTAINGNETVTLAGGKAKFAQYYVPAIVGFGVISACYANLAFSVSIRRENGILKRTRGTPIAPVAYVAGLVGNVIVISLILAALTISLGLLVYGISFPGRYIGLIVTIAAAAFSFSAIGVLVSTFVPNEDAATAIINFILFPLLFISGTFGRVEPGSALGTVAGFFPIQHLNKLMEAVFNPFTDGTGLIGWHLLILLLWGVAATALSLRRFNWMPRST
ncbi:MAG TPA: ABC transporter permease [Acidimicrobiales bacterium]|nr:ABC transporter permease [Acidimicrobiales bacterium]